MFQGLSPPNQLSAGADGREEGLLPDEKAIYIAHDRMATERMPPWCSSAHRKNFHEHAFKPFARLAQTLSTPPYCVKRLSLKPFVYDGFWLTTGKATVNSCWVRLCCGVSVSHQHRAVLKRLRIDAVGNGNQNRHFPTHCCG